MTLKEFIDKYPWAQDHELRGAKSPKSHNSAALHDFRIEGPIEAPKIGFILSGKDE